MEHARILTLTEQHFDDMVQAAGGHRITTDASRETSRSADYHIGDAIIELKLVNENPLEKQQRQQRLAVLFRKEDPSPPTIVLDPARLDTRQRGYYYNIIGSALKHPIKSAAEQLESTVSRVGALTRVLLLVNIGCTALDQHEFPRVALHRVRNDTRRIDAVVIAGVYYYSDGFEMFAFFPFELFPIHLERRFSGFERLRSTWHSFSERYMTDIVRNTDPNRYDKMPILDSCYEFEGVRFVKPTPRIGSPSGFWPNSRPREDPSGRRQFAPVATVFPRLCRAEWERIVTATGGCPFLRESYEGWLQFSQEVLQNEYPVCSPLVCMDVALEGLRQWCQGTQAPLSEQALLAYSANVFNGRAAALASAAQELTERTIVPCEYVLVVVWEIGQDLANDYCSVGIVHERPLQDPLVRELANGVRACFEHGLALGAAYALKYGLQSVLYIRDREHAWE